MAEFYSPCQNVFVVIKMSISKSELRERRNYWITVLRALCLTQLRFSLPGLPVFSQRCQLTARVLCSPCVFSHVFSHSLCSALWCPSLEQHLESRLAWDSARLRNRLQVTLITLIIWTCSVFLLVHWAHLSYMVRLGSGLWLGMGCRSSERLQHGVDFSVTFPSLHTLQLAPGMLPEKNKSRSGLFVG